MASKPKRARKAKKITPANLREKANQFLSSKKYANLLVDILDLFNDKGDSYTSLLLTVEMIFTQLLRRKDMYEIVVPMKPPDTSPEALHAKWLRDNYETAWTCVLACMKRGDEYTRVQALVTACKLMREEGNNPLESCQGIICFPHVRLKNVFSTLLDSEESTFELINRFQEYCEYRDVQQYGLKMMSLLTMPNEELKEGEVPPVDPPDPFRSLQDQNLRYRQPLSAEFCSEVAESTPARRTAPNPIYIKNYLDLFDKLMSHGLPKTPRPFKYERHKEDSYLCEKDGKTAFVYNPEVCRRYINRCWGFMLQWPLRCQEGIHRRALLLLVDRLMPYLSKPQLATDLLCDSLDTGGPISMIALRGMFELVTHFSVDYPDIYDKLYSMFEPEMFATRSKKRLLHLADVFLSSTRISETLVAAFAKRLSRLALAASPEDASALLELVSRVIQRHPNLKRMLRYDQPAVMPKDPYVMEESSANASRAIHSSLWEVSALKMHFTPEVSATAARVLAAADGSAPPPGERFADSEQFDTEVRKRFKTIEMNFVRVPAFAYMTLTERLNRYWHMAEC